jgi:hypothetical protein
MRKLTALGFLLAIVLFAVVGIGALMSTSAVAAGDNPCDPTYGLLQWCKANHGHFDTSCCCCVLH